MTEKTNQPEPTTQTPNQPINWKSNTILGLRFLQVLTLSLVAVGFIWGLGDYINIFMPQGTTAPIYILLILYGVVGSGMIEIPIRVLQRKK